MDEALLLWINQGWANHGLDVFFSALSSRRGFALPLAVVLLLIFLWRWRKAGMQLWLVMLVVVGLGDFMSSPSIAPVTPWPPRCVNCTTRPVNPAAPA
jgi:hypothetical protein